MARSSKVDRHTRPALPPQGRGESDESRVAVLGPPGAGKGTQSHRLAERFGVPHVSAGALLRTEIVAATPLGRQAAAAIKQGHMAPDGLVTKLILERLAKPDARTGFVLDGSGGEVEVFRRVLDALGVSTPSPT